MAVLTSSPRCARRCPEQPAVAQGRRSRATIRRITNGAPESLTAIERISEKLHGGVARCADTRRTRVSACASSVRLLSKRQKDEVTRRCVQRWIFLSRDLFVSHLPVTVKHMHGVGPVIAYVNAVPRPSSRPSSRARQGGTGSASAEAGNRQASSCLRIALALFVIGWCSDGRTRLRRALAGGHLVGVFIDLDQARGT